MIDIIHFNGYYWFRVCGFNIDKYLEISSLTNKYIYHMTPFMIIHQNIMGQGSCLHDVEMNETHLFLQINLFYTVLAMQSCLALNS